MASFEAKPPILEQGTRPSSHNNNNKKRPRHVHNNIQTRRGRPRRFSHGNAKRPPPKKTPLECSECHASQPKYKCPKCRAPYCSIKCCKSHKETSCNSNDNHEERNNDNQSKYLPTHWKFTDPLHVTTSTAKSPQQVQDEFLANLEDQDLEEEWKINKSMMDLMERSDWLRNELKDGGLRQVIYGIIQSQQPQQHVALQQAKTKYPNFGSFLDKLLVLTGVLERDSHNNGDLEEWLQHSGSPGEPLGHLVMKPTPRLEEHSTAIQVDSENDDEEDSSSHESSSDASSGDSSSSDNDDTTSSSDSD